MAAQPGCADIKCNAVDDTVAMLTAVARCWRTARDAGAPVQHALHKALALFGHDMLTPAIHSLLMLYERAVGRAIVVGSERRSSDERLLGGLLDGSAMRKDCLQCDEAVACTLDCAIRSTRAMIVSASEQSRP